MKRPSDLVVNCQERDNAWPELSRGAGRKVPRLVPAWVPTLAQGTLLATWSMRSTSRGRVVQGTEGHQPGGQLSSGRAPASSSRYDRTTSGATYTSGGTGHSHTRDQTRA